MKLAMEDIEDSGLDTLCEWMLTHFEVEKQRKKDEDDASL